MQKQTMADGKTSKQNVSVNRSQAQTVVFCLEATLRGNKVDYSSRAEEEIRALVKELKRTFQIQEVE